MLLVVIVIGAVVVAAFWRPILKLAIAALVVGFVFLLISGVLDILNVLHALVP